MHDNKRHTFIVRQWWEPGGQAYPGEWRGEIVRVEDGETLAFRDLVQMIAFVIKVLASGYRF